MHRRNARGWIVGLQVIANPATIFHLRGGARRSGVRMCGIVGGIAAAPFEFLDEGGRLDRAIDSLAHRGPDDRGSFVSADRRAFLGHRRLSIIDIAGGHEPIPDEASRRHLNYNGEIYNHRSLRDELSARGHVFRTKTDGEVALHLYEDRPADFETQLSGMFAISILDEDAGKLTLVRDRNGIKPLYYWQHGDRLIFASELKAILALLPKTPALAPEAVRQYLRWKYVPAPLTIFEHVHELPAGHRLVATLDRERGKLAVKTSRYWSLDFGGDKITDEQDAIEQLDALLRTTVRDYLQADVEVGALLSGGVDSSLVVALASAAAGRRIKTFSVGFREEGFDQLPFAKTLAEKYGTEHHEQIVDVDPMALMPRLVHHFDQPFADSSALACHAVCETAAQHVKVVLTGDGGDETFAGYRRYADLLSAEARDASWRRWMNWAAFNAGAAVFTPEAKFLNRMRAAGFRAVKGYKVLDVTCSRWLAKRLLADAYRGKGEDNVFDEFVFSGRSRGWSTLDAVQFADLNTYLPGDILRKVDRASMASSLECRVPLLDHAVTEFAARLPVNLRVRDGEGKYILKKVAERYVPRELIYRKKRGFRVPIRRWFKGELLGQTADLLRDGALVSRGVLDPRGVAWIARAQRRPWMNLSSTLWALLVFEHWARKYLG